jgi:hypothetical protein
MIMKTRFPIQKSNEAGSALMLTMIMGAIGLAILAGVMTWSASSNRLTHRSIQYNRSVAAAEGATEKVESEITRDFLSGGASMVSQNLNTYQGVVPLSSDSSYWSTWQFNDGNGNLNQTFVQLTPGTNSVVLDAPYTGLKGYASICTVVSHARDTADAQDVTGGVLQQLELTGIPIFQFGLYSSGNMEISCGQPFTNTGPVHCNGILYIEPDNQLTFASDVTAVVNVLFQRDTADGDTRGAPAGSVVYEQTNSPTFPVAALTLPIGTTNTPEAIREIIEPPQSGEDPHSAIGLLRYYNQCDMVLTVSDTGISATSGEFNHFATSITNSELALFVTTTNNSFWDGREKKFVEPIDINIGNLTSWSTNNNSLRPVLIAVNGSSSYVMNSIYVVDSRTPLTLPPGNLGAVRVFNGTNLPPNGLTVATGRPLYVLGDYNDTANLGTADTSATRPASLVADAITILSDAWQDLRQQSASVNGAADTTVNAAFLTGVVETAPPPSPAFTGYSGGMENFPRFLEDWSSATFTYNGSMVKMFPSLYATGLWAGTYYSPPSRNWAYDANFDDPTKLPPHTPQLLKVIRGQWVTVPPNVNVAATAP